MSKLTRQLSRGQLADRTAKYDDLAAEARRVSMTTSAAHQRLTFGRVSSTASRKNHSRGCQENLVSQYQREAVSRASSSSGSIDVDDADSNSSDKVHVQNGNGAFKQEGFLPNSAPFISAMRRSQSAIGFSEPSAHGSVYHRAYQGKERLADQSYRFVKTSDAHNRHVIRDTDTCLGSAQTSRVKRPKPGMNSASLPSCASQPQLHLDIMLPVAGKVSVSTGRAKSAIGPRGFVPTTSYREKYMLLAAGRREREMTARRLFKPRSSVR